ncbi:MAG: ribosome small subunit-dependent GTPase A [Planctomycetota bacterium]|nr:MAG: ribosome small subunit-dependent GTPase A [Planctomycetota bacterium]
MASKKKKIRTEFKKNRTPRARPTDWTRKYAGEALDEDKIAREERLSGKGELTRRRTVVGIETDADAGLDVLRDVDASECVAGRVLSVHGLTSTVAGDDGREYRCATRRLLKTLLTEQRNVVAAGDRVAVRPANAGATEGIIERIEPRRNSLSRTFRGRQHVLVANVDQLAIVGSAAEPYLKPNLIDRFLLTAEKNRIRPIVCINKVDLIDATELQPLVGVYAQLGYDVLLLSATTGFGVERLRRRLCGAATVICGQSGVGKSSLLNAAEPGLGLKIGEISEETQKGKHTTTAARLIPLAAGGYVVDTPGIRQFQLWDVIPEEVSGFYRDLRPFENLCAFPDCTHIHEAACAVKDAVADGQLDARRYESYCQVREGDEA